MKPALALVTGGLGCFAIASQVSFVGEFLAVFAGNELCLGIIFSCWFAGIALGAGFGGRLAQRTASNPVPLIVCCLVMAACLPALMTLVRCWRGILEIPAGELPGLTTLLATGLLIITPFALLIGLSFPLVCRVATDGNDALTIGRVYVMESVGAIAGGLAVGILLTGWVSPYESVTITSFPLLAGVALFCLARRISRPVVYLGGTLSVVLLAVLVLMLTGQVAHLDQLTAGIRFDDLGTRAKRIAFSDTPYQHLDLALLGDQYTLYADGKITTVFPDSYATPLRTHLVMTAHPNPKRVLVLGYVSIEFLPSALLHPVERIDLVEMDPQVIELLEPHLSEQSRQALKDKRAHLHSTDGRRFVEQADSNWDLIFSDAPDPATAALNRFYTREFFERVRSRLAPGGVFVTRLSSSVNFLGAETATLIATVQKTLQLVFSQVIVLPGEETVFLASDTTGILLDDPDQLGVRYQSREIQDPKFSRHHFKVLFQADLVIDLQKQLQARGEAHLNTDIHPVTYLQSVLRWSHLSGDGAAGPLRFLVSIPAWIWFCVVFFVFGAIAVFGIRRKSEPLTSRYSGAVLAIGVVGGAGLAIELVLTYSYQAHFGSLYRELGLIVAAFMAGLVLGGLVINRRLFRKPGSSRMLGLILLGLAGFTAVLPLLLSSAILGVLPHLLGQVYLLLLVLISGIGTGVVFPLASYLSVTSGRPLARAAGTLDAVDHWGATLGAFLTGIILVPALGHTATCLLLALPILLSGMQNIMLHISPDVVKA